MRRLWQGFLLTAVAAAAVLGVGYLAQPKPYTVQAYFVSAELVVPQNDVTIGGDVVGKVTSVQLVPEGSQALGGVLITMQIDPAHAPLKQGTRAEIRPKGLIGSMFIQLTPGGSGNPDIPSGGVIPLHDTAAPVTLDEVQDIFDPQTRTWVKILTVEGGKTFAGSSGADLNELLKQLPSITANTSDVSGTLASRDRELDQLDLEFDRIAFQMASEDRAFRDDFSSGATILNAMAGHDRQLQSEVIYANLALAELNAALNGHTGDLNQSFKELPGVLADLKVFNEQSGLTLSAIYPCMGDIIQTLNEMSSATGYNHPGGSSDGQGAMLRVYPVLQGTENGSRVPGQASCSGRLP